MVHLEAVPVEELVAVGVVGLAIVGIEFGEEGEVAHLDEFVAQIG